MNDKKNELNLNFTNAHSIQVNDITQSIVVNENEALIDEIDDLINLLNSRNIDDNEKTKLRNALTTSKNAIEQKEAPSTVARILTNAGEILKDLIKEAGKATIAAFIKANM